MTGTSFYSCCLPEFPRGTVIDKGREGRFFVSISRNGKVLFVSEQPLAELAGAPAVLAVRPWLDRSAGTIVQIRARRPVSRPVEPVEARLVLDEPDAALRVLPLSPCAFLCLQAFAADEVGG